jgi:hypothetical protein
MNTKSINKQNRPNLKRTVSNDTQTLIFIIATIVITVGLVLYALFSIIKPFENKSFEDIKVVTEEDYLSQEGNKSKEYYVFIYQEGNYKQEMLDKGLVRYANYARKNKEARPIYRLDFGNDFYNKLKNALGYTEENYQTNLPTLVCLNSEVRIKSSLEMRRLCHNFFVSSAIPSTNTSGVSPAFCAASSIFCPCSSIPVRKKTSCPIKRLNRAKTSQAIVV